MHVVPRLATWTSLLVLAMSAQAQTTQKQYQLQKSGDGPAELKLVDAPVRQPAENEVLVRVRATSLNRRDIYVKAARYPGGLKPNLVPLSDGAGEVVATGAKATRFKKGDRVAAIFFPEWIDGRPPVVLASLGGGGVDGMLSQFVTLNENSLVAIPKHLSYEEAATLPCAGVTAWNALVTRGHTRPGDFVLLQGTGGVSILGLQLAVALGARPVITSSHDDKLARAKQLGAVFTINYKTNIDWPRHVRDATGGGVQQVLEVGGKQTLASSLESLAPGGHVALIGGLTEFGGDIPAYSLMGRNVTASGIYVGSRADFEALNEFLAKHPFKPVIDKVFEFENARAAYDYMDSGALFGKVVIRL